MYDLEQKIKDLAGEIEAIEKSFDLSGKEKKARSLEAEMTDPDFWDNRVSATKMSKDLNTINSEISEFKSLKDDILTLSKMAEEGNVDSSFKKDIVALESRLKRFKIASFLSGPYDNKNAILSLHAGQGGTEAMDWVSMLYRMYSRYCEIKGWKTEVLDISEGEEAGIKRLTLRVEGEYAYGYLKGEAGTHRLVRQSPFNSDQKRETSFALLEVMPEFEERDLPDIEIKDEDLDWQFFRASSQGGQNVQKVSSAVRLIHKPTDIVVSAQTERYQEQNRKYALNLLRAKLWALEEKKREEKLENIKGEYRPASWGNQIRSYVLHPYKMVKDLRTQVETSDTDGVLDGKLDKFVEAEIKFQKKPAVN